jgi:hypothetical protein
MFHVLSLVIHVRKTNPRISPLPTRPELPPFPPELGDTFMNRILPEWRTAAHLFPRKGRPFLIARKRPLNLTGPVKGSGRRDTAVGLLQDLAQGGGHPVAEAPR